MDPATATLLASIYKGVGVEGFVIVGQTFVLVAIVWALIGGAKYVLQNTVSRTLYESLQKELADKVDALVVETARRSS